MKWTHYLQVSFLIYMVIVTSITGCGVNSLKPMYASSLINDPGLIKKLSSVRITTIPGRAGQIIRNELAFQSFNRNYQVTPRYRLDITVTERITSTLVNFSGDSAGQIYQIDAKFKLIEIFNDKVIANGVSYGRAGFERFSSIFSNVRAREDATKRAAITVARDIKSQLELALHRV